MKKKTLQAVIFGPQGSGKGTQGTLLAERFGVPIIGAGDIFRMEISSKSKLGTLVGQYVEKGLLAPDELGNAIMARQMKKIDTSQGFILDGYPRNVEQAIHLDKMIKIKLAIQLKISDEEVLRRLEGRRQCPKCRAVYHETDAPPSIKGICAQCGATLIRRKDDVPEIINERLKAYHYMTAPLAGYYRQRGVLLVVNGEQPIPYVFEDLLKKMEKLGFKP